MLSQNRLHASVSYYGIGTFTNQDLKPNEVAMEITANYSISSFDDLFPQMDVVDVVFEDYIMKNKTDMVDINDMRMILNLNWFRYMNDKKDRFWKIYFENLPKYHDFLPLWGSEEKEILRKLVNDPGVENLLFHVNRTNLRYLIEDVKKALKKIDSNYPNLILNDNKIYDALNIINSRAFPISLKGYKIIKNNVDAIDKNDIYNIGVILVPGADAINYERMGPQHPDVRETQVKYEFGKIVVKAGRHFKQGEEFFINYDTYGTVYSIFKRYGFVPIDAVYNSMIWKNNYIDLSMAPLPSQLVCQALSACLRELSPGIFEVPKFTNRFDIAHLNVERLRYWDGPPFTESKMIEIYSEIMEGKHSNITEGIALSSLSHEFYGYLLYSSNFKIDFDTLVSMYNQNENRVPVPKILENHNLKSFRIKITKQSYETPHRFRELLKYVLLNTHIVALNTREAISRLDITLDNLLNNLKKEMIEEVS